MLPAVFEREALQMEAPTPTATTGARARRSAKQRVLDQLVPAFLLGVVTGQPVGQFFASAAVHSRNPRRARTSPR
jgi:hypothetical protein